MYSETFAERLKHARLEAGYTQQQIAEITKVPRNNLAKYETGRAEPSIETLATLLQFYNISANWVLGITLEPEIKITNK